jgi:peptide/nickel transport system permease protein
MTAPLHDSGSASLEASAEAPAPAAVQIAGRSPGQIAWARLKRDKVALVGGVVVVLLILVALFAPVITHFLGAPIDQPNGSLIDPNLGTPKGTLGGISGSHLLGVDPTFGRDVFSRIVYGARVSMLVAFLAAGLAVILGTLLGSAAGYFGGWIDAVISRVMDVLLAFPQLLFSIALISVLPDRVFGMSGSAPRIGVLVVVIGFFGWPYIGRIVRGQTLSLREREFVEAAKSLGARPGRILIKELLPNLVAPILVYTTLMIPTNILTEAALSYLGVGVKPPTPSWGQMLSDALNTYTIDPAYMIIPGLAIFITVLAFNLFGDGLRDALDPKGS